MGSEQGNTQAGLGYSLSQGPRAGQGSATQQGSGWHLLCRERLLVRGGEEVAFFEWDGISSPCDVLFWDVFTCLLST